MENDWCHIQFWDVTCKVYNNVKRHAVMYRIKKRLNFMIHFLNFPHSDLEFWTIVVTMHHIGLLSLIKLFNIVSFHLHLTKFWFPLCIFYFFMNSCYLAKSQKLIPWGLLIKNLYQPKADLFSWSLHFAFCLLPWF